LCFKSDELWSLGGKHGLSASTHWLLCQKIYTFVCSPSYFCFFGLCTLMGECWMNPPPWVKFFSSNFHALHKKTHRCWQLRAKFLVWDPSIWRLQLGSSLHTNYRYKLLHGKGCPCHCGAPNCHGRLYYQKTLENSSTTKIFPPSNIMDNLFRILLPMWGLWSHPATPIHLLKTLTRFASALVPVAQTFITQFVASKCFSNHMKAKQQWEHMV
jgi:hypothetical protein